MDDSQSDDISITRTGHCACAVSRDQLSRGKNDSHFEIHHPIYLFTDVTTKIKPCCMRKIAFILLWMIHSVRRMRRITWPIYWGSPKTTHSLTIFDPNLSFSLYNFFVCTPGAVHDVITPANFGEDRFRGFGVAMGRILAFSIDLLRRL